MADDYNRRKEMCREIESLSRPELEELYRILRREGGEYSENSNGVFFNAVSLPQALFNDLQSFLQFTKTNRASIEDRSSLFHTLGVEPLSEKEKLTMDATIEDHPSLGKKTIR